MKKSATDSQWVRNGSYCGSAANRCENSGHPTDSAVPDQLIKNYGGCRFCVAFQQSLAIIWYGSSRIIRMHTKPSVLDEYDRWIYIIFIISMRCQLWISLAGTPPVDFAFDRSSTLARSRYLVRLWCSAACFSPLVFSLLVLRLVSPPVAYRALLYTLSGPRRSRCRINHLFVY